MRAVHDTLLNSLVVSINLRSFEIEIFKQVFDLCHLNNLVEVLDMAEA